jgi:3-dehydroquinate synthase
MNSINVFAEAEYSVDIDCTWLDSLLPLLEGRSRAAVIVSAAMRSRIQELPSLDCEIFYFEIPDGEEGKSTKVIGQLWDWLGAAGFTRSDLIVAVGGGAITDVAGFAAASWLRGLDWVAIPTTLAGMVDAAIGGKTAVNSDYGKNLIGAFHSPIRVLIDLSWLQTLDDRDFAAGLAEVVKTGFIADTKILDLLKDRSLASVRSDANLTRELISRSVAVKASVVSEDFKESYARESLNYGHTFGHAIELDSKFTLRHGECVSIGLAFMAHLQYRIGAISLAERDLHLEILSNLDLPIHYREGEWPKLLGHMARDKKSRGKSLRFVTLSGLGSTGRLENPSESDLFAAYTEVSS